MTKWEYRTTVIMETDLYDDMNDAGANGWELVQILPAPPHEMLHGVKLPMLQPVYKRPSVQGVDTKG